MKERASVFVVSISIIFLVAAVFPQSPPKRARDLGVPLEGTPGKYNAITDIPGVEVGYSTIIKGSGKLKIGEGPVRTGVTVIMPRGKTDGEYNMGYFIFNGDGEMTGIPYTHDYGRGGGPIGLTNTNSVGVVRDAIGEWQFNKFGSKTDSDFSYGLPTVAETWDGFLNDINGAHVKKEHVFAAIESAASGQLKEGSVGGGTGMTAYYLKAGSGTASRIVKIGTKEYTVGVFVQANFGTLPDLVIAGVPVGKELSDLEPREGPAKDGSIIIVVGTDAPLTSGFLNLVTKRATLGIARTGAIGNHGSGDIFMAFSTASREFDRATQTFTERSIVKSGLNPIFRATVEATEEAIINSMIAAEDMEGSNGNKVFALPHERLRAALKKYNRLKQ